MVLEGDIKVTYREEKAICFYMFPKGKCPNAQNFMDCLRIWKGTLSAENMGRTAERRSSIGFHIVHARMH